MLPDRSRSAWPSRAGCRSQRLVNRLLTDQLRRLSGRARLPLTRIPPRSGPRAAESAANPVKSLPLTILPPERRSIIFILRVQRFAVWQRSTSAHRLQLRRRCVSERFVTVGTLSREPDGSWRMFAPPSFSIVGCPAARNGGGPEQAPQFQLGARQVGGVILQAGRD